MASETVPIARAPETTRAKRKQRGLIAEVIRHWADYLYVLPAIAVMVVVIGYPLVYTVYLSFMKTSSRSNAKTWTGLDNFRTILSSNSDFWDVTKNTLYWTFGSTALAFVLGFAAALVVQKEFIGRGFVRGILMIPYVISAVSAAYVWRWLYHSDNGLISDFLIRLHLIDDRYVFLDSVDHVMPSVIIANVWKEFPFVMIMLLAGLQTVPDALMRAASIDGAGTWNRFWHITVPHLKGVILITTLLLFVANLNSFTLVWIMTGGGPANASQLWITEIYSIAFRSVQYGMASAWSVILFIIMALIGYFYVKAMTSGDERSAA